MPVSPWAAGNQLVALNYQTGDLPYHVNFGKFLENGSTGYVIKPDYMLYKQVPEPSAGIRMIINVISATHLPKPGGAQKGEIIDPFVVVHITGPTAADCFEARTKTIIDNGFNPVWNHVSPFLLSLASQLSLYFTLPRFASTVTSCLAMRFSKCCILILILTLFICFCFFRTVL
jgi:hypothetical protein